MVCSNFVTLMNMVVLLDPGLALVWLGVLSAGVTATAITTASICWRHWRVCL